MCYSLLHGQDAGALTEIPESVGFEEADGSGFIIGMQNLSRIYR
jgi:hypothetical protein